MAIIAGIGTAVSIGAKLLEADAQAQANKKNQKAAEEAAAQSMRQISLRQVQERDLSSQTIYQMDLEARRADAETRVSAGESGVAGTSVDILLADIERQRLSAQQGVQNNLKDTLTQLDEERKSVSATKQQRINGVPAPNTAATALRIGGDVAEGVGGYIRTRSKGTG